MAEPEFDLSRIKPFGLRKEDEQIAPSKGLVMPGLVSGAHDIAGLVGGGAVEGLGRLTGMRGVEEAGHGFSERRQAASAAAGREDLEVAPWKEGGANVLPWLGYQTAKQIPMLGAYLLGGKAYARAGGVAPAGAARIGAQVPRALGGGGLKAGADMAARRAAMREGADLATQVTGGAIAGVPIAFGSMIQEAGQKEGGLTDADARQAALLSPVYSLLDATQPAALKGLLKRGQVGGLVKRVATAAFAGAAAEVPQEGMQTALEMTFRPDLSNAEKFSNIVDAAITGGAVGGAFGSVGGIRSMKRAPAAAVSSDDLAAVIDQELLQLPAPSQPGGPQNFAPEGGPIDLDQRAAPSDPADPAPAGLPSPGDIEGRRALDGSTIIVGRRNDQGRFTNEATGVEQPPVVPDDTSRAFRNFTNEELFSASNALANKQQAGGLAPEQLEIAKAVEAELAFRNAPATSNGVGDVASRGGVAQPELTLGGEGAEIAAPVSVNSWETDRGEMLKGIATRRWYKEAANPEELAAIVRGRLEAGSTATSDFKLAERLGLDPNAPAAAIEAPAAAAPTVAAPVVTDEAFAAEWKADRQKMGQKDKGVRAIKPANLADAQQQIYAALGADTEIGDGLERLAQKYGILDAEKRLTPTAVAIAQQEPITTEASIKAARAQGFKGAEASQFDTGVRAFLAGEEIAQEGAAAAGAKWAAETNSVPRGALKKYDPAAYTGQVTDDQVDAMGKPIPQPETRARPTGEVLAKQTANKAIDATKDAFATPDDDVAQLKRMVRDGDVDGAMMALQRVQSGERLFSQPERGPAQPLKGERVDATSRALRGLKGKAQSQLDYDRDMQSQSKKFTRAQADQAIRKYEINRAIDAAVAEGTIDGKQRIRLLAKLKSGRIDEVLAEIPVTFSGQKKLRPTDLSERTALRARLRQMSEELDAEQEQEAADAESAVEELTVDRDGVLRAARFQVPSSDLMPSAKVLELQAALEGKTALQVAEMLVDRAPGMFQRTVAKAIVKAMGQLNRAGMKFEFHVVRAGGPAAPEILSEARGVAWDDVENDTTSVWINGTDAVGPHGLSYEVVLHEMLHAVTMQATGWVQHYKKFDTPLGKAVQDLLLVTDVIKAHFANRQQQGNLTELEEYVLESNALDNPDEVLAWALSSPEFQSYIDTIDYTPRQTLWGKFVESMRVFLGLGARGDGALVEVLRASEQIIAFGPAELELAVAGHGAGGMAAMRAPPGVAPRTSAAAKSIVQRLVEKIPIESVRVSWRRALLGWNSITHMVAHYTKQFPQLALYSKAHYERRSTQARWAQLFESPYQRYETLERENPKAATNIGYLMSLTQFEIDPTKTWAQHEYLHDAPNAARLQELVADANRKYQVLRGNGHASIYDDFRAINEGSHTAMMSVSLHNLVTSDPVLKTGMEGFETDPTDDFRERPALHENAQNARRYWSDTLDNQVKRAEAYIQQLRGETVGSSAEQRVASMRLEPIEMRIRSIRESQNAMRRAPYFHLGRHGEHFVSFTLRLGDDKNVDQAALEHAGKVIQEAGFSNIEISRDQTKPNVFIRVDTIEARHQLRDIAKKLKADGWLKPESEIKAAPRSDASNTGTADQAPAWLDRYIELLQASPMFDPTDEMTDDEKSAMAGKKAQMVSHARELWLDMLPDTAIAKVMVHRNSTPGFDKDMIRNFAFRFQVGVNSLSNLSAAAKLTNAFTEMRGAIFDAQIVGGRQNKDVDLLQSLLTEVLVRESQRPIANSADWVDTWRAINHSFFLGFSPSYVLVNTTQIGVLLWPELAKKHGFVKSAKAISGVTATAFNIMRETLRAGMAVGPKRALDAVITENVLKNVVDEKTAAYLMKILADGIIDIGGSSREMGRIADGSVSAKLDTALRWSSSFGLYSETFTRLVAALAARDLNGDDTAYARKVIEQSMLNYADWSTGRQLGKMGFAGPMTKVMTAFMQYNAQVLEKLYREFHTAIINESSTAEEKQEARRFIGAHLAAVTVLAGTLGLPFATVAATVLEKIVGVLGDDDDPPWDATAAWRNYLKNLLGPRLGEMAARGLPRAGGYGFDLSARAGEQNLLPFSQFLTDKRKWREASSELALRSSGAPVSMVLNIVEGGDMISDGDVLNGLIKMMPMSLKGPTTAYRMTAEGYIDTKGNKLPMTPGASAVLSQLIGLTPQAKAQYSEALGDQAALESVLVARAKVLRTQINRAVIAKDHEALPELLERAKAFDRANPTYAVLPDIRKSVNYQMKSQAISKVTGTPIGVNPNDKYARDLTDYASIEFAPR